MPIKQMVKMSSRVDKDAPPKLISIENCIRNLVPRWYRVPEGVLINALRKGETLTSIKYAYKLVNVKVKEESH